MSQPSPIDDTYKYGFSQPENYLFKSKRGLDEGVVRSISGHKSEPEWMREYRLRSHGVYLKKHMPPWGADLSGIHFDDIYYYIKPIKDKASSWEDLPIEIRDTYDKIGIPEAEKKFLAGVSAQYECITADALVFGNPSATPIANIKPEQCVYAWDEKNKKLVKQKVLGVAHKGKRLVFKIKVAGRELRCTKNHPLLSLQYKKDPDKNRGAFRSVWEHLENLKVGDYVAIVKDLPDTGKPYELPFISFKSEYRGKNQKKAYSVSTEKLFTRRQKKLQLPSATSEDFLWFLGLYVSDGYITTASKKNEGKVLNIAIPKTELNLRKKLQEVVFRIFCYELSDEKDIYRIRIFSKPIINLLLALELAGNARTKKAPSWIFQLPKSQKLAFIGGYIDSDGYLRNGKKNSDVWITSVNKKLLETVQMVGISCGLHVTGIHEFSYTPDVKNKLRRNIGYRLQITGDVSSLSPYSLKVNAGFVPRQYYHKYASHHKSPITSHITDQLGYAPIQEIIPLGEEDVYDIEVEGHHNFIANGIVVHNSEVIYKSIHKTLTKQGVVFLDMDSGLREYPDLVREYFGTIIPPQDNKFAALNSAVWSGGSFVYVPKGVKVELPLQAYFRINAANMGQFERTLIIADEGSYVHYVEGCTAPVYTTDSLHSAVVEIVVKRGARVRYTTIQNWSTNVYNLVTKRARVEEEGTMEWVDGNLGSKITMKYPSVYLMGRKARGEVLSIAYAGKNQHQDAGGKAVHAAPETTSQIISKSISKGGGRTSYRGLVQVNQGAVKCKSKVVCDALLLDEASRSDTYPDMQINEQDTMIEHEATVSKVGDEQLFYLQSRGIPDTLAQSMVVNGFIEPIVKELPLEYAVEMNRLIQIQMEGSIG